MLKQAIQLAKGDDADRVGISLKISVTLKGKLAKVAKENRISSNALICSILYLSLNDDMFKK